MTAPDCPWCGGASVVPLLFGMPDGTLMDQAGRGEVALGGCMPPDDRRAWWCRTCRSELGPPDDRPDGPVEVLQVGDPWRRAVDAPFEVIAGDLPVVVHVPHAGLHVPEEVRADLLLDDRDLAREQRAITDHLTDVLAAPAIEAGALGLVNRLSRLVVDPERLPAGTEPMEAVGMGAVYTHTTDGTRLRRHAPARRRRLVQAHVDPYAAAMTALVRDVVDRHGRCTIVDLHSYPVSPLPYERTRGERPPLCIGVDLHTPPRLLDAVRDAAAGHGLTAGVNEPFAGTYVPLDLLGDPRVSSVMLEVRRDQYLEVGADPGGWRDQPDEWVRADPDGLARVQSLVTEVVRSAARIARDHDPA